MTTPRPPIDEATIAEKVRRDAEESLALAGQAIIGEVVRLQRSSAVALPKSLRTSAQDYLDALAILDDSS